MIKLLRNHHRFSSYHFVAFLIIIITITVTPTYVSLMVNLVLLADKCDRCDEQAICVNGTCECKQGFVGNGFTCIGECLKSKAKFVTFRVEAFCISPWFLSAVGNPCQPNPCENGGTCNPGHGGKLFECVCKEGFSGSKCEGGKV